MEHLIFYEKSIFKHLFNECTLHFCSKSPEINILQPLYFSLNIFIKEISLSKL